MGIFTNDGKLQTGWASKSDGLDMNEQRRLLAIELRKQDVKLCNPVQDLTYEIFEFLEDTVIFPPTDILIQAENGNYQAIVLGDQGNTFHIQYLCSTVKGGGVGLINKIKELGKPITLESLPSVKGYYEKQGFNYIDKKETDTMIWVPPPKGGRRTRRRKNKKKTSRKY
jgi:hypothetical protein